MSLKYLNLSGLEDLWINIKNYILSKVPTKTSELTNDSGYLTSHQSLSNYVTLNTAQEITSAKIFKNTTTTRKLTSVEAGNVIPSSDKLISDIWQDKNGKELGRIYYSKTKGGNTALIMRAGDWFTSNEGVYTLDASGTNRRAELHLYTDSSGNCCIKPVGYFSTHIKPLNSSVCLAEYGKPFGVAYVNQVRFTNATLQVDVDIAATEEHSIGFFGKNNGPLSYITFQKRPSFKDRVAIRVQTSSSSYKSYDFDATCFYPESSNSVDIGSTTNIFKNIYCNNYYKGTTAFGDIVTHNASEFLTSHQSLANYVTTNTSQSISGIKTFPTNINLANTSTSQREYWALKFSKTDTNGTGTSQIGVYQPSNSNDFVACLRLGNPRGDNKPTTGTGVNTGNCWSGIGVYYNYALNRGYPYAPSCNSWSDSSNADAELASTAWVRRYCETTKGFLTSHQSLANYVTTDTVQDIAGNKNFKGLITTIPNETLWPATTNTTADITSLGSSSIHIEHKASGKLTDLSGGAWTVVELGEGCFFFRINNGTDIRFKHFPTNTVNRIPVVSDANRFINGVTPNEDNTYSLGTSSLRWKACYSNAYYLGTTAFGDIVTHNASEFLTSHQSLSSCVKNVVTNSQSIKSTAITRGTAPSSAQTFGIAFSDNNNKYIGNIYGQYATDKSTYVGLYAYKGSTTSNGDNASVRVGYDASGNAYTYAPTPATTDNSTQIATTAFVKAQGYLTSHQSLANYALDANVVHTSGNETIGGNKTFSKYITSDGSTTGDEYSSNAKTNLWLMSNRDTEDASGVLFDTYRQNTAQGTGIHILGLGIKENSVRYEGCRWGWYWDNNLNGYTFDFKPTMQGANQAVEHNLGTRVAKWDTINGLEPSSLSLPSGDINDIIDISGYLTILDGSNVNTYVAPANGWISILMNNCSSVQGYITGLWGHQIIRPTVGSVRFFMPVLKNKTVNILVLGGTIDNARFIPCQGNV